MDHVRVLFYWSRTLLHHTQEFARRTRLHDISFSEEPGAPWSILPQDEGPIELAVAMSQPWERTGIVRDMARQRRFTSNGALASIAAALTNRPCPYVAYRRHYLWTSEHAARIRRVCLVIGPADRYKDNPYTRAQTQLEACGIEFWAGALFEYLNGTPTGLPRPSRRSSSRP